MTKNSGINVGSHMLVFQKDYASCYDHLYAKKNYEMECDIIEEHFRRSGDGKIKTILDLGCGTGGHAVTLAQRGYKVTGVDLSPDMISIAREKCASFEATKRPEFLVGNIQDVDLGKTFDAVIMMFAVLGYQITNEEVLATLRNVRRHLHVGGIFICDVWYGPAVLTIRPSNRAKTVLTKDGRITRNASTTLDTLHHTTNIRYHVQHYCGDRLASETTEIHCMRYFFLQELALFASMSRMRVKTVADFSNCRRRPSSDSWNIIVTMNSINER